MDKFPKKLINALFMIYSQLYSLCYYFIIDAISKNWEFPQMRFSEIKYFGQSKKAKKYE